MGLFGASKEKKIQAEIEIIQAFSKHPALTLFSDNIANPKDEHKWMCSVEGYYDSCVRIIIVEKDILGIVNCSPYEFLSDGNKDYKSVYIRFTDLGYTPLPSYQNRDGDVYFEISHVAKLLAETVGQIIAEIHPNYQIGEVRIEKNKEGDFGCAYFDYRLPPLNWKSWF